MGTRASSSLVVMIGTAEAYESWVHLSDQLCFMLAWPPSQQGNASAVAGEVVLFVRALLSSTLQLDAQRIFLAGFGVGAAAAYILAMNGPHLFSAFATVSGLPAAHETCVPSQPHALLHIHATDDEQVPAAGSSAYEPLLSALEAMQAAGGACRAVAGQWTHVASSASAGDLLWLQTLQPEASATATLANAYCELRATCVGGADVVRCLGKFGHTWPLWATEVAWRFFDFAAARISGRANERRPLIEKWSHYGNPVSLPPCRSDAGAPAIPRVTGAVDHATDFETQRVKAGAVAAVAAATAAAMNQTCTLLGAPPPLPPRSPLPELSTHGQMIHRIWAALLLGCCSVAIVVRSLMRTDTSMCNRRRAPALLGIALDGVDKGCCTSRHTDELVIVTHVPPLEPSACAQIGGACCISTAIEYSDGAAGEDT